MLRIARGVCIGVLLGLVLHGGLRAEVPEGWLRRVWLDLTGAPPPAEAVDAYLARPDDAARRATVARLAGTPECAARWAHLLAERLAPDEDPAAGRALEPFLAGELRAARPWWRTLAALVAPGKAGSPSALFQRPFHDDGTLIAGQLASGMLGIQLRCARCHDDPVHGWTAAAHFGLAAFYGRPRSVRAPARLVAAFRAGRVRNFYELVMLLPTMRPRGPDHRWVRAEVEHAADLLGQLHHLGLGPSPPQVHGLDWAAYDVYRLHAQRAHMGRGGDFGSTTAVPIPGTIEELRMPKLVELPGQSKSIGPKTGQSVPPRFPGDQDAAPAGKNRREALTAWIADPENPFTARALVNRAWARLIGRGLVEPVDEVEHPKDAAGADALAKLAAAFVESGGTLPWLLERIVLSPEYARPVAVPSCLADNPRDWPVLSEPPPAPASAPSALTSAPAPAPAAPAPSAAATAPSTAATEATTGTSGSATEATTATTGVASEASLQLAAFRFRESEAENACLRERQPGRDGAARLAARGWRPLDGDQIAAALAGATGQPASAVTTGLRAELTSALELWAASARTLPDEAVVASWPPRLVAASPQLQSLVRGAPVLAALPGLPDPGARADYLFRRALARPATAAEKAAAGADWTALLFRLVTSAEFLTNH